MRSPQSPSWTQSGWVWLLLFLVVTVLLGWRQPTALLKPMFPKEDGVIFFKDAYEKGWLAALFSYYAGYMTLAARIVSVACQALPLSWEPTVYAGTSLALAAGSMCFFYLPQFRAVVAEDAVRGLVVLAMPLMPNAETLMRLAGLLWYMLFVLILITLMALPANRLGLWSLWIVGALAAWSNPVSIVCVPVLVVRAWGAEAREQRWWWVTLALATLAYALTAEHVHSALDALRQKPGWPLWLVNALSLRVFCYFFFGDTLAHCFLVAGWGPIVQLGFLLAAVCALVVCAHQRRAGGFALPALFYFVLVLPLLVVLRPEWLADFGTSAVPAWAWHGRYFYLSVLLLCILAGVCFELDRHSRLQRLLAAGLYVGWLSLHALSFRQGGWQANPGWKHYARLIEAAEAATPRTAVTPVHVVLADVEFSFDLMVKRRQPVSASPAP